MHVVDSLILAFSQGKTRRGSYASYMDITHPEILEFLDIRKPSGGDIHRKCLNLHHGVNIPNKFMELIDNCIKEPTYDELKDALSNYLNPSDDTTETSEGVTASTTPTTNTGTTTAKTENVEDAFDELFNS